MRGNLFTYVHRVGAVEVHRATLPQLARDLQVRARDLESLIARMGAVGQVSSSGDVLRFALPVPAEVRP